MKMITGVKFKINGKSILDFGKLPIMQEYPEQTLREIAYLLYVANKKKHKFVDYYFYLSLHYNKKYYNNEYGIKNKIKELEEWRSKMPEEVRMIQIKRRDWCLL